MLHEINHKTKHLRKVSGALSERPLGLFGRVLAANFVALSRVRRDGDHFVDSIVTIMTIVSE
jgi:hypothetical protein